MYEQRSIVLPWLLLISVFLYGEVAADELRTWADASNSFQVKASFVALDEGKVKLKLANGRLVEIELEKLSEADQAFVKQTVEDSNPFQALPAPANLGKLVATEERVVKGDSSKAREVDMTPKQSGWKFPRNEPVKALSGLLDKPIPVPAMTEFGEKLRAYLISEPSRRALLGYTTGHPKWDSRVVLCDLTKGTSIASDKIAGQYTPMALHDNGVQVLMRREGRYPHERKEVLEMWTISEGRVEKGLQWIPFDNFKGEERDVAWVEFLDDERVAMNNGHGAFGVWKIGTVTPIYQARANVAPALSPDRKLLVFSNKNLRVMDLDKGEVLAELTPPTLSYSVMQFSPSGNRVGITSWDRLYVWDFTTGELTHDVPLRGTQLPRVPVCWAGENHIFVGPHRHLADVDNRLLLWDYGGHAVARAGDMCWLYVGRGTKHPGALVPLKVPHPAALEALEKAKAEPDFYVLKKGTTVKIDVSGIPEEERENVRARLTKNLEKNGFRAAEDGTIDLIASMTEDTKKHSVTYRGFGIPTSTYKMTQYVSRLKFVHGEHVAWQHWGKNIPDFINVGEKETVKKVLKRYERPFYEWFEGVQLPEWLIKPTGSSTLGKSPVTVTGLPAE